MAEKTEKSKVNEAVEAFLAAMKGIDLSKVEGPRSASGKSILIVSINKEVLGGGAVGSIQIYRVTK